MKGVVVGRSWLACVVGWPSCLGSAKVGSACVGWLGMVVVGGRGRGVHDTPQPEPAPRRLLFIKFFFIFSPRTRKVYQHVA